MSERSEVMPRVRRVIAALKRRKRLLIVVVAVVVVGYAGALIAKGRSKNGDDDVRTEIVKSGPLVVKIRETGVLKPLYSVEVKSNVEGEIERLLVREGDVVSKGDLLVKLDDEAIREQRLQQQANLESAEAEVERAKRNVELTRVRQDGQLAEAEDGVEIAEAALDAARRTTAQQLTSADLEIANTENGIAQDRIALNQANIAAKQVSLALESALSRLESARVSREYAEAEVQRVRELFVQGFASKSQVEQTETERASAENQFEQAEQAVSTQDEAVRNQTEAVASRQQALEHKESTLELQRENLETLKGARVAVERQAELQLATAITRLTQVRDTMEAELANSGSTLLVAEASRFRAESALKNAQERLEWTSVDASMDGTVIALRIEEGEIVQSGRSGFSQAGAMMTIADLAQMVIKTAVNEVDIPKIEVDQPVEIRLDAYRERVFDGAVKEISPRAEIRDNVTKFEVEIEVQGSPAELRPGMNVDVDIVVADRESVVQLPIETLIETRKLVVKLPVPPMEVGSLNSGLAVEVESRSGKRFPGRIGSTEPDGQYSVVVLIDDDAPQGLRSGLRTLSLVVPAQGDAEERSIGDLSAEIVSERKELVLLRDEEDDSSDKVGLLSRFRGGKKPDKKPGREHPIKVGLRNDTAFEIAEGLAPGDEVIVPELSRVIGGGN